MFKYSLFKKKKKTICFANYNIVPLLSGAKIKNENLACVQPPLPNFFLRGVAAVHRLRKSGYMYFSRYDRTLVAQSLGYHFVSPAPFSLSTCSESVLHGQPPIPKMIKVVTSHYSYNMKNKQMMKSG